MVGGRKERREGGMMAEVEDRSANEHYMTRTLSAELYPGPVLRQLLPNWRMLSARMPAVHCFMNHLVSLLVSALTIGNILITIYFQNVFALQSPWITPTADGNSAVYSSAYSSRVQTLELARLSSESFVTVGHQSFPSYQVRVKQVTGFCDPTVR